MDLRTILPLIAGAIWAGLGLSSRPALADAPPIPSYLQRMPDSWEFRWPTGAVLPLYQDQDVEERAAPSERLSSRIRRIPREELKEQIHPRSIEALRLLRRAFEAHRHGELRRRLPQAIRDRLPSGAPTALAPPRLWRVEFTLRAGDNAREWMPVRVALADPGELAELIESRDAMGLSSQFDRDPSAVGAPAADENVLVDFLSPYVGLMAEEWGDAEKLLYPRTSGLVTSSGKLDRALMRELFFVPMSDLEEAAHWRGRRILDARAPGGPESPGAVLVDGRAGGEFPSGAIAAIRKDPARYLLQEDPPRCRVGEDSLLLHQLVWEDAKGFHPVQESLSMGSSGRRFVTSITPGAYPETRPRRPGNPDLAAWAAGVAARLDSGRLLDRVAQIDGEREADPALTGKRGVRFVNRSTLFTSQLPDLERYLIAHYRTLGLEARTQACPYHSKSFRNVWVDFPGTSDEWVVLVDHTDTAIAQETRNRPVARMEAAPGADDDATATATLMEAGALISSELGRAGTKPLRHGIRLLHLTGEEFPSDCLGARHYVPDALARGEKIRAVLVMDMIGFSGPGGRMTDSVLQLNLGEHPFAGTMAGAALDALDALKKQEAAPPSLEPVIRGRFDRLSYLYNTDGIIFSDVGFPVMLVNEHINREHRLEREGYHDRKDVVANLCGPYFTGLARMTLAAALILAGGGG